MNYKIVNASISYGADTILEEINFEIKEKDKIAIVGRNGSGKTTLLKAIVDNSMLEEGIGESKFAIYKQGTPKIGYLKQIEFENSSSTMLEEILKAYQPLVELEKKINKMAEKLQTQSSSELIENYTKDLEKFEFQGGYTYQKEYETAMSYINKNLPKLTEKSKIQDDIYLKEIDDEKNIAFVTLNDKNIDNSVKLL